ncbi:MAG: endolytic transglycosylase MltG [Betaproteobacteria bacterium]|nr:endolytic transglycosylase MltG [Betaproteobacteria bacterium]MCC7216765.1 endolytic transglycosylase MltG [Burkholderiales bacterium]
MLARLVRIAALVVAAFAVAGGVLAWRAYTQPLPLPNAPFAFDVPAGSSLSAVARELAAAGALREPWSLIALARWRGADRAIKAGSYEVDTGITLPQLLAKLTQGDVTQKTVVFVEGATFADVRRLLRANPDVKNTVLDLPDAELMARLDMTGGSLEGRFFPDTYFFAAGSTDFALLNRARRALDARLAAAWEHRATDLPLRTPYEALILASIVEKETGRAADRPLIASVFVNRLRRGMRLQTDPTVIYGMGTAFDGDLKRRDLETDTPWNTYTRDGLPPTPIALPSQASLDAVLNPPVTGYLYFVARGDGTSKFSATLPEHNRAVSQFQKGGR